MTDSEPRFTSSRALRASVGLTALAAVLLACGAAVETTGNLLAPTANTTGTTPHPAPPVHPPRPLPRPSTPPPTYPPRHPTPTPTSAATTGSPLNAVTEVRAASSTRQPSRARP